jgi:hypothetical protein
MNAISEKRALLYMQKLGYVPHRPLTRHERILCGLKVSEQFKEEKYATGKVNTISSGDNGRKGVSSGNAKPSYARKHKKRRTGYTANNRTPMVRDCITRDYKATTGDRWQFIDPRSHIVGKGDNRRVRLFGSDMEALRTAAYMRAQGKCQQLSVWLLADHPLSMCERDAPLHGSLWTRGHMAHLRHGPIKTDELGCIEVLGIAGHPTGVIWKCAVCHLQEHGLRWTKPRKVKPMNERDFEAYFIGEKCLCGGSKASTALICETCRDLLRDLQPALLHVIENGSPETVKQGLAELLDCYRYAA